MKIGLFDSGLGGLTILRAVAAELPEYDYVYFGDTAHLPLGDKSEEEIFNYTKEGVERLFAEDAALVIIACNTASAETLRRLQDGFLTERYPDRRILGVIIPTVEAIEASGVRQALLLATRRTVASRKYDRELADRHLDLKLDSVAVPELVPLIEKGQADEAAKLALRTIADLEEKPEAIILGCTHYTKIKEALRAGYPKTTIFSQDEIIPRRLTDYLSRHPEIEGLLTRSRTRSIILSLERPDYAGTIKELLGGDLG